MICQPDQLEHDDPLPSADEQRRYSQLRRVLMTAEILRGYHFGLLVEDLSREVCERMGETWNERTTRRDVHFLAAMGFVESRTTDLGVKWRWLSQRALSITVRVEAEREASHS